jgi:4-amino-4-deoxy-L-arabinose transferase-like glycosyltransferase
MLLLFLGALIWLIRILLENRRWGRIFTMQTNVHGKLIDRFGNNEELLSYMNTEAGKRFLEAAPIPIGFEPDRRVPAALSRVLVPLQIGVVLTLLGIGLLALRHSLREISSPLLVFGIVMLMPGVGFIISAGITWMLAARLGLMPRSTHELSDSGDRP